MNGKEKEAPNSEPIWLGQEFVLFDPHLTVYEKEHYETKLQPPRWVYAGYKSSRSLKLSPQIPPIPFQIKADYGPFIPHPFAGRPPKFTIMTPFDPELGYQIDERDFNLEERIKKIEEDEDLKRAPNLRQASLSIFVPNDLEHESDKYLRVRLFFPNGLSFESQSPSLSTFYPPDIGPLPKGEKIILGRGWVLSHGFMLQVPEDLEKLQQIVAKFVISIS